MPGASPRGLPGRHLVRLPASAAQAGDGAGPGLGTPGLSPGVLVPMGMEPARRAGIGSATPKLPSAVDVRSGRTETDEPTRPGGRKVTFATERAVHFFCP